MPIDLVTMEDRGTNLETNVPVDLLTIGNAGQEISNGINVGTRKLFFSSFTFLRGRTFVTNGEAGMCFVVFF